MDVACSLLLPRRREPPERSIGQLLSAWWARVNNPFASRTRKTTAMLSDGCIAHVTLYRKSPDDFVQVTVHKVTWGGRRVRVMDIHRLEASRQAEDLWYYAWDDLIG